MARRRRNDRDSGAILLLLAVGFLILVMFYILIPAAVVLWWLMSEVLCFWNRGQVSLANVSATPPERKEILRLTNAASSHRQARDGLIQDGIRHQLRTRSDGLFDERSGKGRTLNAGILSHGGRLQTVEASLASLEGAIQGRVNAWVRKRSLRAGSRTGVATFVVVLLTVMAIRPAFALQVASFSPFYEHTDPQTKAVLGCVAVAGVCAWAANAVAFGIKRRSLTR